MFSYHWFSFPWYFSSWTNGEPHHSGFKSQIVALSFWCEMFLVQRFFCRESIEWCPSIVSRYFKRIIVIIVIIIPYEKLIVAQWVNKFCVTTGFTILFVRAHQCTVSWVKWTQSTVTSSFFKTEFNIIRSSTPRSTKCSIPRLFDQQLHLWYLPCDIILPLLTCFGDCYINLEIILLVFRLIFENLITYLPLARSLPCSRHLPMGAIPRQIDG
jgi:hypothetical protein